MRFKMSMFYFFYLLPYLTKRLLWSKIVTPTALSFSAVGGPWVQPSVTLPANQLVTVVFLGQNLQRRFDNATSKSKNQVEGRFLLNVVVGQSPAVPELFSGEDQSLLIRWDAFFVLDF